MIENNNFEAENLQQQIQQSDYPSIDNFLANGFSDDTKIIIDTILNDFDLKDSFESFLKTASLKDKMTCKRHLMDAETQDEIKSILLENVPGGSRIVGITPDFSFDDVANDIQENREEEQENREEEQENREEEQENREEEQENREEEQENREEEQENREEEQENREEEQENREEEQENREEEQENREEEQENREEEQENREEEQENREEERENREEEQENREGEQENKEEEQENREEEQNTIDKSYALMQYENVMLLRQNLVEKYPTLDNDTKQGSKAYNETKNLLQNNGTLDKLTDFGIDQDGYISLLATITVAQNNPEYQDLRESQDFSLFYIAMKNLNNACNIPDTSFDSFKENNIANTRAELFHETIGNKGLIEQRQKNIESHRSDYERLFTVKSDDELIQKYGRFLDGEGKTLYEQWERDSSSISPNDVDMLMDSIRSKQEEIESKTKNVVEELCMVSQIKGFLGCLPREYSGQFQFNKANEISMDEDGVLQLNGHIKGVDFSLKQDTSDANARLQTSTMLYRDQDHNLNFTGKYKDSPFILPTASQVFDTALLSLKDDDLSNIHDQDDYFDRLENSILKNMDKLFAGTEYAHHYVESQIKSEEVIHETMQIFHLIGGGSIENLSNIRNEKVYNFFDTIEFNLSVMTNKEKEKFMECLGMLGKQIIEGGNIQGSDDFVKDEQLASFLGSKNSTMKILRGMGGGDNDLSFFDVFKLFFCQDERNETGNRKMINLYEFYDAINGDSGGCLVAMGRYEDMKGSDADAFLEEQIQMC